MLATDVHSCIHTCMHACICPQLYPNDQVVYIEEAMMENMCFLVAPVKSNKKYLNWPKLHVIWIQQDFWSVYFYWIYAEYAKFG